MHDEEDFSPDDVVCCADVAAQVKTLECEVAEYHVVFDGFPAPDGPRFIEVEDAAGHSINAGDWRKRADGYCELVIKAASAIGPRSEAVGEITAEGLLSLYEDQTRKLPVDTTKLSNGCQVYDWRMDCIRDLRKLLSDARPDSTR